jgi:hypothetical protein
MGRISSAWLAPKITVRTRRTGVPDDAPCAGIGIDEQFGAQAELSPLRRYWGDGIPSPAAEVACELSKPLGAVVRYGQSDHVQPARACGSRWVSRGWPEWHPHEAA